MFHRYHFLSDVNLIFFDYFKYNPESHNFSQAGDFIGIVVPVTIEHRLRIGLNDNKTLGIDVFDIELVAHEYRCFFTFLFVANVVYITGTVVIVRLSKFCWWVDVMAYFWELQFAGFLLYLIARLEVVRELFYELWLLNGTAERFLYLYALTFLGYKTAWTLHFGFILGFLWGLVGSCISL